MSNQNKTYDKETANKIISEYADKINYYMKENYSLKNQIEDMKITLNINKDILFNYFSTNSKPEDVNLLKQYKNDNLRLLQKNEKLHNEKTLLDKKVQY